MQTTRSPLLWPRARRWVNRGRGPRGRLFISAIATPAGISGAVLLFPNYEQGRNIMQVANIVHMACALLAIAMSCFHIYLGTLGFKGAYDAMRTGYADETWAKEHHQIWYEEVKAGRARQHTVDQVPAEVRTQIDQTLRSA